MNTKDIENLKPEDFKNLFNKVLVRIKSDPLANFVKARGFLNFVPSHAQQVILKVIFGQLLDGDVLRPVVLDSVDEEGVFSLNNNTLMTEVDMYRYLTGRDYDPETALDRVVNNINLICGRRSGKTTLVAIIAIFCAITINWKPYLHKTPFATVLIMSHSKEFSDEVLDIIKLFIMESPILARLINGDRKQTASTLNLIMPFILPNDTTQNSQVQIKVGAASSKTTRGVAACVAMCDEIAFWNVDENMKQTDADILKAVRPALKQFGKKGMLFKLSSPGIRQGVLYDEFKRYGEGTLPDSYEVFKAALWVMNPAIPVDELAQEYKYDPEGFMVEYGAEFMESMSSFILPATINHAVADGIPRFAPDDDRELKYRASLDSAFKKDRFTFTLVASSGDRVRQYISHSWSGTKKKPVIAHEVAEWIANATKDYPIDFIVADQFAFSPLREIFAQHDLILQEYVFTSTSKKKIYFNLKKLFHSGQLDILDVAIQTKELMELVVEQSPSGNVKISHPRGGTDDFADALAIACMMAVEGQGSGMFSFEEALSVLDYGIETDKNGVAFSAPSVEMLVRSGHLQENIIDNSSEYGVDPSDGRLKRWVDFEGADDEEDGTGFGFDF